LVYLFQRKLEEGLVYALSFFTVVPSSGAYRSTPHAYKLLFQMKTRVDLCEGPHISRYAFTLSTVAQLRDCPPEYDYLVGWFIFLFLFLVYFIVSCFAVFYFVNFLSFSRYHWFGYWVVF
jgi:hypothetical protein